MTLLDRIKKLCNDRGITVLKLENDLEFGENTVYQWKKRTPSVERVQKVADYFDVSTDYLLGREEKEEEGFVTFFRANTSDLSDDKKQLLEEELMAFMEARRKFLDGKGK